VYFPSKEISTDNEVRQTGTCIPDQHTGQYDTAIDDHIVGSENPAGFDMD